ncbi:MAG: GDP-mannose 4,6-dehydratase [Candidatus Omnitrophica bacterium]|nr:GDP-mannose 4,6-dehydratase [Candidatus Omnitrophota bacterium]MDD5690520.1 GDP-mannose 4,6-dehydratase [Candidatus Omnitrophota bacterium]
MANNLFAGKKVLIAGGMGFIGSNLARELVRLKANVLIIDSMFPSCGGNNFNIKGLRGKCKIVIKDIREQLLINNLVKNQDFIFSLAGQVSHVSSLDNPFWDLENNCRAQLSLLEACKKYNPKAKIVFSGTRGEYGKSVYLPVDESHPMKPVDINGINKMAAESYYLLYHRNYGLRTVSLRLTNTYGPGMQMKNNTQGFLNLFIRLAMDGRDIKIFGKGAQVRDFNYIDDVTSAFLISAVNNNSDGQSFNLGSDAPISIIDVAKLVIELCGRGRIKHVPFPEEYKMTEVGDYVSNNKKIKRTLGWKPRVALRKGLGETIDYYKKYKEYYW